jgi:TetR/AcrR family transcriptional regulator, cholesterol catabolism regulator
MAHEKLWAVNSASSPDVVPTHEALVLSATSLFSSQTFAATSISDIAGTVGAAKGVFYHYFVSKEDILKNILDDFLHSTVEEIAKIESGDGTASQRIGDFFEAIIRSISAKPQHARIFTQERRYLDPATFGKALSEGDAIIASLATILEQGMVLGEFRQVGSPRVMAYGLLGMCLWTYQWYRPRGLAAEQISAIYAEIALGGLAPGGRLTDLVQSTDDLTANAVELPHPSASADSRTRLLNAALELFRQHGYHATPISQISKAAGLTNGAFYSQFASKSAILSEILVDYLAVLLDAMSAAIRSDNEPAQNLLNLMTACMRTVKRHNASLTIFLQEWRFFDQDGFESVRARSARVVDDFRRVLDEGTHAFAFRNLGPTRVLAYGLIGMYSWIYQELSPTEVDPDETAWMYTDVVLHGLRAGRAG